MVLTPAIEGRTTIEANNKSRAMRNEIRQMLSTCRLLHYPVQDRGNHPQELNEVGVLGEPLKAPLSIHASQSQLFPKGLIIQPIYQSGRGNAYKNGMLSVVANQHLFPKPVAIIFEGDAFSEDSDNAPAKAFRAFRENFAHHPEKLPGIAFVGRLADFRGFVFSAFCSLDAEVA